MSRCKSSGGGSLKDAVHRSDSRWQMSALLHHESSSDISTCDGRTDGHGDGHHAQEESDGLRHVLRAHQLEGDGSHDADETAVEQTHEQTHGDQPAENITQRNHHRHHTDDQE